MKRTIAILALAAMTLTASAQDQKPKHHHKKVWIAVAVSAAVAAGTIAYVETKDDHRKMFRLRIPIGPIGIRPSAPVH